MLKIDIHTHIIPKDLPKFKNKFGYGGFIELAHKTPTCAHMMRDDGKFFRAINSNCWDPETRLKECDEQHIQVQVLSTIPILFNYWTEPKHGHDISQFLNDHIAEIVANFPKRFIGLGTLPLQDPELAVLELERCVNDLGFPGVEIGSNVNGNNLDHPSLFPVYEKAQALNACIFVHPWQMIGTKEMPDYWLPWLVGMPAETARAVCSLIFGGVFARFPKLRFCFAHGGGSFPATVGRIAHGFNVRPDLCATKNTVDPREYLGHFYVDSLVHDPLMLDYLLKTVGANKIVLGSDYPFPLGELSPGALIDSMQEWPETQKAQLLHENAMTWLGIEKERFYD